jgi:hypothetical protein
MDPVRNPFAPGAGNPPPELAGRAEILETARIALKRAALGRATKRYMRALAELGPGSHRSGDVAEILGVKSTSVAPTRGYLIKKGIIYSQAHGDVAFTVPLFDEYMRRAMPELEAQRPRGKRT